MSRMPTMDAAARTSRRRGLLPWVPALLILGLAARFGLDGLVADLAGGVAYTAFAYVLVALLLPDWAPIRVAAAALAFSFAIELFQLTGLPADLNAWFSPLRLVLGTSFAASDLAAYAVGAALAFAVDGWARARVRDRRDDPGDRDDAALGPPRRRSPDPTGRVTSSP